MRKHTGARCKLRFLLWCMFFTLGISSPLPVIAQAVPYARTYAKSNEEVDKALKEMQAYTGQRLPVLDGFVASADHPLDRYQRAYYQFSIDLLPAGPGSAVVRVTAKITAWYTDREPWKSGYQVLPSNGRLELDLLDRLSDKLGGKPAASASSPDVEAPKPKLNLSGLASSPLTPSKIPVPAPTVFARTAPGGSEGEELTALRAQREAEEKRMRQLNEELQNLEEIQRSQAHPANLVVVKKAGTPVLARPAADSRVLFLAAVDDEFESLETNGEWIHVQISGPLRGYIRRSNVDLPEDVASRLKSPDGTTANVKPEVFRVEREEARIFPGKWEPLAGKSVKIYTVRSISQDLKTDAAAKRNFAFSLFQKFSEDSSGGAAPGVEGVVVTFDSADGGIVGATLATLKQMMAGSLSRDNFWKLCYLDPPDAFQPSP